VNAAGFRSPLRVEDVDEFAGIWQLTEPLRYYSAVLKREITVPAGFKTDFASVPRIPFVYDAEGGKCDKAAVVHDWLYSIGSSAGGVSREQADQVLREAILASGYSTATAAIFYAAVRVGGGSHWRQENVAQPLDVSANMEAFATFMRAGA
jgi:hypothetical protein